jgi:hypothetical protein
LRCSTTSEGCRMNFIVTPCGASNFH